MNRLFSVALAAIALTGCATQPVPTSEATPVPTDRMLSQDYAQPREGSGAVIVKRDDGYLAMGCSVRLLVDSKPVADLNRAERVNLYLPAGESVLSVMQVGICSGGRMAEAAVTATPDRVTTFRIGFSLSGEFSLERTAF